MTWLQVKFLATRDQAEALAAALEARGAMAVSLEDAGDEPLFGQAPEDAPLWSRTWVSALFPAETDVEALVGRLRAELDLAPALEWKSELLPDQDWERAWMDRFQPIHFGERLWVVPSWLEPPDPGAVNIVVDPGLAFGTGTHATTALCLGWLARHSESLQAGTVFDYGCGSGILAIAALKLGARHAVGVDIDERALDVSADNADRNDVAARLELGLPERLADGRQADVVLANILAGPLLDLAPTLVSLVRPGGRLILSGLLADQVEEVRERYAPWIRLDAELRDGWAMLAGTRPGV